MVSVSLLIAFAATAFFILVYAVAERAMISNRSECKCFAERDKEGKSEISVGKLHEYSEENNVFY